MGVINCVAEGSRKENGSASFSALLPGRGGC
jgi:hypothetical protein